MSNSTWRHGALLGLLLMAPVGLAACAAAAGPKLTPLVVVTGSDPIAPDQPTPRGTVTIAFAGDVHFQLQVAGLLQHPRGALGPIARALADADVAMVNLESAITTGGTRDPKELEDAWDRYWFRTPPAALDLLDRAGIDVVTMANNHGADYGATGLRDTLRARRHGPLPVIGVGRDRADAFAPYRVTVRGTDLAFLAADTTFREGASPVWAAGPSTPGIAAARPPRHQHLLAAVRAASRRDDVVVVYLHWGAERGSCPNPTQRLLARDLAAAGADVVVGSGNHLVCGSGWLGDTYVNYGLGNFVWYHNHDPQTGVLQLRIQDGAVVDDAWRPARLGIWGRPNPLGGAARRSAISDWRELRVAADLGASPHPLLARPPMRDPERSVQEGP